MLGFFPQPYPNELLYSVLARYYVRSGYSNYVFAAEDLFQNRYVRPSFEYISPLNDEVIIYLKKETDIQEILLNHTMFPYHCRFLPIERKNNAMQTLIAMDSNYRNYILFPKRIKTPTMRYCPECVHDDSKQYGETYWHRIHQICELKICPVHHCNLINTAFTLSGKTSPNLIPAEIVVTDNEKGILCEDERLCVLSDYVNEIFEFPIVLDKACSVAQVLQRKTDNTEYRSPRGAVCRITDLYKDFTYFFGGLLEDIPEQWKVHKILTGQRFNFFEVVLLGFFLGIEPQDYQGETKSEKTQNEVFDIKIHLLHEDGLSYSQIANKMGLSLDTIKNAAYISKRKAKPRDRKGDKPGRRPLDWDSLDSEMLAKVVETITELKSSDKPQRITVGGVARLVGLKSKQIDKLTQCKAEIEQHCQSQEEFWAEKVLGAWRVLSKEGRIISIKQIRLKTNMSTEQMKRCMGELEKKNQIVFKEISIKL